MGLINARNLRKAKQLLDKNRHKVGDLAEKAGEKLDKVTDGKSSNITSKATEAAKKYSDAGMTHTGREVPVDQANFHQGGPTGPAVSQEEANAASIAAANAVREAAAAATNLMNNAAVQAQLAQAQQLAAEQGEPAPKIQATHDPKRPDDA